MLAGAGRGTRKPLSNTMRAVCILAVCALSMPAVAGSLADNTHLLNITQRMRFSETPERLGRGGYELTGGEFVDFRKWYIQKWIDIEFHFMTQINENIGLLWGFSTGEWGPKYRIHPAFKLGAIFQIRLSRSATLSFSATRHFGGGFEERPCMADYGEIAGVQKVNCRLAASELEPAETLQYLFRSKRVESWIGVRYQSSF